MENLVSLGEGGTLFEDFYLVYLCPSYNFFRKKAFMAQVSIEKYFICA
jgi:hypothetical protein